jgi:uncharacterized protein (TIGR00645 family)
MSNRAFRLRPDAASVIQRNFALSHLTYDRQGWGGVETFMNWLGRAIEMAILQSRWLLTPFLLGLIIGLAALLYTFIVKLAAFLALVRTASEEEVIVGVLKLVDLSLTANLLLIVICSGYENFVTRVGRARRESWPDGLIGIRFANLKQRLLGSILAIAAINVLEWFMDIDRNVDNIKLGWVVGILLAFAVAMVLLAIADRLSGTSAEKSE